MAIKYIAKTKEGDWRSSTSKTGGSGKNFDSLKEAIARTSQVKNTEAILIKESPKSGWLLATTALIKKSVSAFPANVVPKKVKKEPPKTILKGAKIESQATLTRKKVKIRKAALTEPEMLEKTEFKEKILNITQSFKFDPLDLERMNAKKKRRR